MPKELYDEVITTFQNAGASMRCQQAKSLLGELGFNVKDGRKGGHKVFTHPHLEGFTSGSLNCDHGRNPEIKKPYIKKIIKVLEKYENELVKYLEKRDG
ncbi:HicA toxin of toxin-antitoxin [Colwellia chukchiensis]|uniref:HicA toxin of toxin-antitoxin n=2 Tax=Alteromonadales TaxID=135622 RepID=A0A1H7KGH9_9GAMM|nr:MULTISPECIES: type II toxin-antitoxin system HicA family toxin [Alteromonadales]MBE0353113.1 hypothetical protein [Pseudoalteromonas lipolytica LMEB 39]SEK85634.1 HicA toxin of toxin-antitoxin [Colwellia chukchiensis]SFT55112.1 HicA toxin of toxin-antitoxin [Pseudoalteromonas lipolytica]